MVVVGAGTASAAPPAATQFGERIDSYDVNAVVGKDGTARVTETIEYNFGANNKHGIERFIQVRFELNSDDPILEGRDTSSRW